MIQPSWQPVSKQKQAFSFPFPAPLRPDPSSYMGNIYIWLHFHKEVGMYTAYSACDIFKYPFGHEWEILGIPSKPSIHSEYDRVNTYIRDNHAADEWVLAINIYNWVLELLKLGAEPAHARKLADMWGYAYMHTYTSKLTGSYFNTVGLTGIRQ